jgi:hypothetical protein
LFLLQNLSPATNSICIENRYVLNVNVKYDGCGCCSDHPSISVPLTIIPLTNPNVYGFPEPLGF